MSVWVKIKYVMTRTFIPLVILPFLLSQWSCGPQQTKFLGDRDSNSGALFIAPVNAANGTYGTGCKNPSSSGYHAATDAWSLAVGSYNGSLTNSLLSVVRNNSACQLTLVSILVGTSTFTPSSTFVIGSSYQGSDLLFTDGANGAFYGNAKIGDATYASATDTLTIKTTAAVNTVTSNIVYMNSALYQAVFTATAPLYTADTSGLVVQVNSSNVVTNVSGSVALTAVGQTGQHYVVDATLGDGAPDNPITSGTEMAAKVQSAYGAGTPVAIATAPAASAFTLSGVDLSTPKKRTIIVANLSGGNTSYEAITITFSVNQLSSGGVRIVYASSGSYTTTNPYIGTGWINSSTINGVYLIYVAHGGETITNLIATTYNATTAAQTFEIYQSSNAGSSATDLKIGGTGSTAAFNVTIASSGHGGTTSGPSTALTAGYWYYVHYATGSQSSSNGGVIIQMQINN